MRISIIGGGITGLTTALALNKLGIASTVYERSPELKEVGAGIWLQPNALKVLDWIGIGKEIRANGMELNKVELTNQKLIPIKEIKSEITQDENGLKIIAIHRGRLQKVLYDALPAGSVQLDKPYQSHSIENGKIKIQFKNATVETDLMLGADGINSNVRKDLFPQTKLRNSGQICWRGISKIKLPTEFTQLGREAWGKNIRFGFSQVSADKTYWFAVAKSAQDLSTEANTLKTELKSMFNNFNPIVNDIIEHTEANKIIKGDLSDLKRLPTWHKGPVCLLGDAAHATTPNMGQGAGQGIEDAYYFSNVFATANNPADAFKKFEKMRRKKVDFIVKNSWLFGKMAHSSVGQPVIKTIMKLTPEKVMIKQMRNMYSIDAFDPRA